MIVTREQAERMAWEQSQYRAINEDGKRSILYLDDRGFTTSGPICAIPTETLQRIISYPHKPVWIGEPIIMSGK